jgi:hypothetical protein
MATLPSTAGVYPMPSGSTDPQIGTYGNLGLDLSF